MEIQWTDGLTFSEQTKTMNPKESKCWTWGETKRDTFRDSEGTKRPLTFLLWWDVPSEMSQPYSWKGHQAHKVKPTQSCYTQHQRQVQGLSCSPWARLKTAALIPLTTRCCCSGQRSAGCTNPNKLIPLWQLAKLKMLSLMWIGVVALWTCLVFDE